MRARLARPRRIVRGRLIAPVAAAAAVALVGGVVVALPDAPLVRENVQTVAVEIPQFTVGVAVSFDLRTAVETGFGITGVTGLPDGVVFNEATKFIEGTPKASGYSSVTVNGTMNGRASTITVPVIVLNADGTMPAGVGSSGEAQGSLGGEAQAGGQITTGSDGTDALLGAVASIVVALGGDAGSVAELATGSTGGTTTPETGDTPTGPLGSITGSLGNTTPEQPGDQPAPGSDSLGSTTTGNAEGGTTGNLSTDSLGSQGPLGSTTTGDAETPTTGSTTGGDATTNVGGEITTPGSTGTTLEIPGSSTTGTTGSLGDFAPTLALTGAALLGLAGLSMVLNGGSSTPGATLSLPGLLGSTAGGNGGSSGSNSNGSSGPVAPIVAAGVPEKPKQAPGPEVMNGRG